MQITKIFQGLSQKQKYAITTIAVVLATFIICYKIIYQTAASKVGYYNNKLEEVSAQNELRRQLQRLDEANVKYEELVMQPSRIDAINDKISKFATVAGAKVISISSVRKPGPVNYDAFMTTIELACSYHQLGALLSEIENQQPYIGIISVNIAPSQAPQAAEPGAIATMNLVLETYALRK